MDGSQISPQMIFENCISPKKAKGPSVNRVDRRIHEHFFDVYLGHLGYLALVPRAKKRLIIVSSGLKCAIKKTQTNFDSFDFLITLGVS